MLLKRTHPSEMTSLTAENFPKLLNDRLLRAAKGEEVDRAPVWVMRQVFTFTLMTTFNLFYNNPISGWQILA